MQIGESFVGEGVNAAHVNTVLGRRDGPVGQAWATALAMPRAGHAAFMVVAQPGVAAIPPTLFVNKASIADDAHGALTWGAAQAGVAGGLGLALDHRVIDPDVLDELVLLVAVWVNPSAEDEGAVYANNRQATFQSLRRGAEGGADLAPFLRAARQPFNPYFSSEGLRG
jgi:5,6,7,8-tetrahydromethanopterin hydro-lyase